MEAPSLLFRLAGSTGQVIGKLASNTEAICSFLCTPIRTGGQFCSKTFRQTSEMADNLAKTASNLLSVLPEGTQVRGQHVSSCWRSLLCLLRTQMCFRLTCLSQQQRWLTQCRVLLSVTCQSRNCMSCSGMTNTQHVCRQVVSTSADKPCRAYTAVIARSTLLAASVSPNLCWTSASVLDTSVLSSTFSSSAVALCCRLFAQVVYILGSCSCKLKKHATLCNPARSFYGHTAAYW